jgi:ATP-dependent Clp protease, protease subunit
MEHYIKFYAPIMPNTTIQLQRLVEQLWRQDLTTLHLLLSTPGGSVHDGLSMYNFLKGLPIEVHTYNFGSVDSIGVVIFCAGNERYSVPNARFLLHPVSKHVFATQVFDEPSMEEQINLLKADQLNIAKVIAATINKGVEDILQQIHKRTTLTPDSAFKIGLVTEIKQSLVPAGAGLSSIYDLQNQQQLFSAPVPPQHLQSFTDIGPQTFTDIGPQNFTSIT